MRIVWVFLAVAISFPLASFAQPGKEPQKLIGTWKLVRGVLGGQELTKELLFPEGAIYTIDDKRIVSTDPKDGRSEKQTYTSDNTKSPHLLDITYTDGLDKGKIQHCIYQVNGGKLTIVLGVPGGKKEDRPKSFVSKENPSALVFFFERAKKAEKK